MTAQKIRQPWRWKLSPHLRWYFFGQAALFLGVEYDTIETMVKRGQLRAEPFPGDVRRRKVIPREDLEAVKQELERALHA